MQRSSPLLIAAGVLGLSAFAAKPAAAQIPVTDVAGNAQWLQQTVTQVKQLAQTAQSYATQLQQYQTELQQYATMVQNTVALPMQAWGTVQSDITQVRNISNAAALLSGNSGTIIQRLQSAGGYASQLSSLGSMPGQFTTWQQTIGNNLHTMGAQLGLQQGQEANNAQLLSTLEAHSATAVGQMQAIQAGNELAGANATQLLQIQATLATTAQMQATQYGVAADRRALGDAALAAFNAPQRVAATGYQAW